MGILKKFLRRRSKPPQDQEQKVILLQQTRTIRDVEPNTMISKENHRSSQDPGINNKQPSFVLTEPQYVCSTNELLAQSMTRKPSSPHSKKNPDRLFKSDMSSPEVIPPPPPSCSNSSLRFHGQQRQEQHASSSSGTRHRTSNHQHPSVHFSPKHVVISSESSTMDLSQALSAADEDEERTFDTSTFATFKTNNSESSMNYLWRYVTCNLGTQSVFELRPQDDLTIDSDLVSAWTGRTGDTGNTNESLDKRQKKVTWSVAS